MFKYTKAAISKTIDDIKNVFHFFGFLLAFIQVPFGIYNLATDSGIFVVNLIMLILSTSYCILYLIAGKMYGGDDKEKKKKGKRVKAKGKQIIRWIKRPVQLYNFAVIIYGLFLFTPENLLFLPIKLLLIVFQIIFFIISLFIDLLVIIFERRKKFFEEAINADVNELKEPTRKTGNFFKKLVGKEPTPEPEQTRTERILDEYIEEQNREKEQVKTTKKEEKRAEKQAKRLAKIAEKQAKKAGKNSENSYEEAEAEAAASDGADEAEAEVVRVRVINNRELDAFDEFPPTPEQTEEAEPKKHSFFNRKK